MRADLPSPLTNNHPDTPHLIQPLDVIHAMIDLRAQVAELELQIQALQTTFGAACLALNTDKISLERAIISRRLTPGRWAYSGESWCKKTYSSCSKSSSNKPMNRSQAERSLGLSNSYCPGLALVRSHFFEQQSALFAGFIV